jgi:Ca2+:H+ antiporter
MEKAESILKLSHGTAIVLLLLYILYLIFQLRTHRNLFDAESQTEGFEEVEDDEPILDPIGAITVLVIVTTLVTFCANYLVDSIDDLVEMSGMSRSFIGLILIPIVGNAAEHATAILMALRNKMDLAMSVAIGSSIQIALLVTPFLVIVGWITGSQMTLHFETCKLRKTDTLG